MSAADPATSDLYLTDLELTEQERAVRDKVRRFLIEFQDRILYGSDSARGDGQSDAEFAAEAHAGWVADWRFLAGSGLLFHQFTRMVQDRLLDRPAGGRLHDDEVDHHDAEQGGNKEEQAAEDVG